MNQTIFELFRDSESQNEARYGPALSDLRFIIERYTMNRYGLEEESDYLTIFYNKDLIKHRVSEEELVLIRYFLVFILFNYPDRAILAAKGIKVTFDSTMSEAIYLGIEVYMAKDDHTTCELIYAITNILDLDERPNKDITRILELFERIMISGGEYSKTAVKDQLEFYHNINIKNRN